MLQFPPLQNGNTDILHFKGMLGYSSGLIHKVCTQCLTNYEHLINNGHYYCYTTITLRFTLKIIIIIRVWL